MHRHILTSEFPPDVGGVSDYTWQVAGGLAQAGDEVHVWCPGSGHARSASNVHVHRELGGFTRRDLRRFSNRLDQFPAPRRLLVQWVPHGFGYHSMNIGLCRWLALRAAAGDRVELMVHEPFMELRPGPVRHIAMALVHRLMTLILMRAVSRVWVSIPAWEQCLRPYALGRDVRIDWLPIPACAVLPSARTGQMIRERYARPGQPLIGHFGTYGREVSTLLEAGVAETMNGDGRPALLLIGAGSDRFGASLVARHPQWDSRVHAVGYVLPTELRMYLEACDLFVQPYPDGISSRRTSAMACLSLGCPMVTTSGHLTESLWSASDAVLLADVADRIGFVSVLERGLADVELRRRVGAQARRLYDERFALRHVIEALRGGEPVVTDLASCA